MKTFHIYHPEHGEMNHNCERGVYNYEHVATVQAISMEAAFVKAQNDFSEMYEKLSLRSTSVGDLIREEGEDPYMIMGTGFEQVQFYELATEDDAPRYEKEGDYIDFEEVVD